MKKHISQYIMVRWVFFSAFLVFFITQLVLAPKTVFAIGFVFVRMCLVTTLIAIFAGIPLKARTWCAVCPMGTLQTKIGSLRKKRIAS
jgi:ferredoxin-type protein NapH